MEQFAFLKELKEVYKWPVLITSYKYNVEDNIRYIYPSGFMQNIKGKFKARLYSHKLSERRENLKQVLDLFAANEISLYEYHFCMFNIFGPSIDHYSLRDITEKTIGKRRYELFQTIPRYEVISNDEFIISSWRTLVDDYDEDYRRNPSLSQVRMLFNPDLFGDYTGRTYYDVDWVEPISNARDMECKRYTKETDPMLTVKDDNYIEGPIIIGTDGGGLRHFVGGHDIRAGSYIEVHFNKGWIPGRYEWGFDKNSPIQVHAGGDVIYINEGHLVRIKR